MCRQHTNAGVVVVVVLLFCWQSKREHADVNKHRFFESITIPYVFFFFFFFHVWIYIFCCWCVWATRWFLCVLCRCQTLAAAATAARMLFFFKYPCINIWYASISIQCCAGLYGNDDYHNGLLQSFGSGRDIKRMIFNFTNKVSLYKRIWLCMQRCGAHCADGYARKQQCICAFSTACIYVLPKKQNVRQCHLSSYLFGWCNGASTRTLIGRRVWRRLNEFREPFNENAYLTFV